MEEERARQEAAAKMAAEEIAEQEKGENQPTIQDVGMTKNVAVGIFESESKASDLMDDKNALLEQALTMSMDSTSNYTTRDIKMLEAASDEELAIGE
ncbi:PREDICTED: 26S proteasome non-ATPase regulatory subunit 4 homolog [Ipomoea nil]|uniref:26S proteasome non-ATPase regulatory subunit 4 homolog n=1 Tax=Ipomoea nil TaxID=35883 RepID=UPI0009015827|nr:PREDICTED: 26S proteasome non-ATPase regulatory subunit 4 homolog [Ipomoea nil]